MEYPITGTMMVVDDYANAYDYSTHSIVTSDYYRLNGKLYRMTSLIAKTYIEHGRYDLLKRVGKSFYIITKEGEGIYFCTNLKRFCEEHGLNYTTMKKAINKDYQTKKGWKVRKA